MTQTFFSIHTLDSLYYFSDLMLMVKKIVLFDKFYNIDSESKKEEMIKRYYKYIRELVKGFERTKLYIQKMRKYDSRFLVVVDGPEETFVYNILRKEIGSVKELETINEEDVLQGNMVDVGKVGFGIFVDCAIVEPHKDVLVNLHTLRDQLANGKEVSAGEIVKAYGFIDHFPLSVSITEIDREQVKILGEITPETLSFFDKMVEEGLEAIFATGTTKGQFKKALINHGHLRDIVSLDRFGYMDHIALFKEDTSAPGIIAEIGKELPGVKLSAIRSIKIKKLRNG